MALKREPRRDSSAIREFSMGDTGRSLPLSRLIYAFSCIYSPGDYGSMVNEVVGNGDWDDSKSLGETWRGRNVFSYGRNEGGIGSSGTARPAVLDKLLATTERVVQEIDSVEYGLSDIQGTTSGH